MFSFFKRGERSKFLYFTTITKNISISGGTRTHDLSYPVSELLYYYTNPLVQIFYLLCIIHLFIYFKKKEE